MKKPTKAIFVLSLALMVALTGCKTGIFAPRTGELFQTTRMGPGRHRGIHPDALRTRWGQGDVLYAGRGRFARKSLRNGAWRDQDRPEHKGVSTRLHAE